jgi:hypothetical protein
MKIRSLILSSVLAVAFAVPAVAQADEIAGTWKFVMRKLPDGKTLEPPAIQGLVRWDNGVFSYVVHWPSPEGKPAFQAGISSYKISDKDYTETVLFCVVDDGSGKPPIYLPAETKTTPVTREGGRVAFKLPFAPVSLAFEGDKDTGTMEGGVVDLWERVR